MNLSSTCIHSSPVLQLCTLIHVRCLRMSRQQVWEAALRYAMHVHKTLWLGLSTSNGVSCRNDSYIARLKSSHCILLDANKLLHSTGELHCARYQVCCNRLCLSARVQHSLRGEVFKGSLSSVQIQNVRIDCQSLNNNLGDCHGALQRNHKCWIAVRKRIHQSHSIGRPA